jgi:hypothetical protein
MGPMKNLWRRRRLRLSLVLGAALAAALAVALGAGASPLANPVPNPGFETDGGVGNPPANWINTGSGVFAPMITRDTSVKHTGAASLKIATVGAVGIARSDCFSGVTGSATYYFSFYYRTSDPNVDSLLPKASWWLDACANGTGELDATMAPIRDGQWHFVEVSGATLATTNHGFVELGIQCAANTTCIANYDDVKLNTSPTAVRVASLAASRSRAGVDLTWRAPTTFDTLGFNVWRSDARGVQYSKLNRSLVLGLGTAYRYHDRTALPGKAYVYRLQLVRPDGSRIWAANVRVRAARS